MGEGGGRRSLTFTCRHRKSRSFSLPNATKWMRRGHSRRNPPRGGQRRRGSAAPGPAVTAGQPDTPRFRDKAALVPHPGYSPLFVRGHLAPTSDPRRGRRRPPAPARPPAKRRAAAGPDGRARGGSRGPVTHRTWWHHTVLPAERKRASRPTASLRDCRLPGRPGSYSAAGSAPASLLIGRGAGAGAAPPGAQSGCTAGAEPRRGRRPGGGEGWGGWSAALHPPAQSWPVGRAGLAASTPFHRRPPSGGVSRAAHPGSGPSCQGNVAGPEAEGQGSPLSELGRGRRLPFFQPFSARSV